MKHLLDTNVCVRFLNGSHPALTQRMLRASPRLLEISSITLAELRFGARSSGRVEANLSRIETFVGGVGVHTFDAACADAFARIKSAQRRLGKPLADFDLAIAATAIAHGCVLVTNDAAFSRVQGLAVEDWTAPPP